MHESNTVELLYLFEFQLETDVQKKAALYVRIETPPANTIEELSEIKYTAFSIVVLSKSFTLILFSYTHFHIKISPSSSSSVETFPPSISLIYFTSSWSALHFCPSIM